MKRLSILAVLVSLLFTAPAASGQSLSDLLQGLGQKRSTVTADSTSTGQKGGLSDLISGVAGALGLGNSKAGIDQLTGRWSYSGPAVNFKSDNFLLKAGGAAAATSVEKKLEPYYKTAGLTNLVVDRKSVV